MELATLRERIREDLDDILPGDGTDDSAALWKDYELNRYFDQAQRRFVSGTNYFHEILSLPVVPDLKDISLPVRVLRIRDQRAFLETAQEEIYERELGGLSSPTDDYGRAGSTSPFLAGTETGRPQFFTLDVRGDKLTLYPTPETEDRLSIAVYYTPREEVADRGRLDIQDPEHVEYVLEGAKAMAYRKHDVDVYDPRLADYWQTMFERRIKEVRGERMRRRRTPGQIRYGGL